MTHNLNPQGRLKSKSAFGPKRTSLVAALGGKADTKSASIQTQSGGVHIAYSITYEASIQIDVRWSGGNDAKTRKNAAEVVALAPNVILASGSSSMGPLMQISGSVPVVFVIVPDPVGAGHVDSPARPGGNATKTLER